MTSRWRRIWSDEVRRGLVVHPAAADIVSRYIAGETVADAVAVAHTQNVHGLSASLALAGTPEPDVRQVADHTRTMLETVDALAADGGLNELSVDPASLGLASGIAIARPQLAKVVAAATRAGVDVTLDMGRPEAVDATLQLHRELLADHPRLGVCLQASLRRTPADLDHLLAPGVRVRLCAGSSAAAFRHRQDADLSFVRCLRALMESGAYPMVATHDSRLLPIAEELATRTGRTPGEYEFQLLLGVRPIEQRRLADTGRRCRVYVPFGAGWASALAGRLETDPWWWLRAVRGRR